MHRMLRIVLLFGLGGLVVAACSSAGKAGSPITVEGPTRHVLHNGVRVLIQVYPSSQVVAVQLWVRAGSRDATELELEKKVVIEEMRLSEDTPRRHLARQLYGMVFDGHPYGRSMLGTPEIIQKLTRETLLGFYRRHYVPESFTLVVVGPV